MHVRKSMQARLSSPLCLWLTDLVPDWLTHSVTDDELSHPPAFTPTSSQNVTTKSSVFIQMWDVCSRRWMYTGRDHLFLSNMIININISAACDFFFFVSIYTQTLKLTFDKIHRGWSFFSPSVQPCPQQLPILPNIFLGALMSTALQWGGWKSLWGDWAFTL